MTGGSKRSLLFFDDYMQVGTIQVSPIRQPEPSKRMPA